MSVSTSFRASAALSPSVIVDGREWLQPFDFTDFDTTWTEVGAVCDSITGECNGSLTSAFGTFDVTGWIWASVDDVDALFSSYLNTPFGPGPDSTSLDSSNSADVQAVTSFFQDFQSNIEFCSLAILGCHDSIEGVSRTETAGAGYVGLWSTFRFAISTDPWDTSSVRTDSTSPTVDMIQGVWLYRYSANVPAPATLSLCLGGLFALGFSRSNQHPYR